jgi:hypothetical protein
VQHTLTEVHVAKLTENCCIKQFAVLFSTLQLSRFRLYYLIGTVVIIAYSLFSVKSFSKQFFTFIFALEMLARVSERTLEGIFSPAEARVPLSHARLSLSSG